MTTTATTTTTTAAREDQTSEVCTAVQLSYGPPITVDSAAHRTAQQVLEEIFTQNGIDAKDEDSTALALWVCARGLRLQMMPDQKLGDTRRKMSQMVKNIPSDQKCCTIESVEPEIVFRVARNGFYTKEDEKIEDVHICRLLYYEAKGNIQENIYPRTALDPDQVIALRIIEALIDKKITSNDDADLADRQAVVKKISSELSYKNSLRKRVLTRSYSKCAAKRQNSTPDFEHLNEAQLYQHYLHICRKLDCYGGFIFEGQMERSFLESLTHGEYYDNKVGIIINPKGLHIVNLHCPKAKIFIGLENLEWGIMVPQKDNYHPCLYVRDADLSKMYQIFTYHAHFIDKTLKNLKSGGGSS